MKLVIIALIFFICNAQAKLSTVLVSGLEFGGDKLVDVSYVDGSTSSIEAGRGLMLGGGLDFNCTEGNTTFCSQATVAIKWTSTRQAKNGIVDWYRYPIELVGYYKNNQIPVKIGGGISYHVGNELKGSHDASFLSTNFNNSVGLIILGDYSLPDNLSLGVRLTFINYKTDQFNETANGNSLGVSLGYVWR